MTPRYDIELALVAAERAAEAARHAASHADIPDWLAHRLAQLAAEAQSFCDAVKEHAK